MLAAVVAVVGVRVATASGGQAPPNTRIAGIAVGGLTGDEAVRAVRAGAVAPAGAVVLELPGEDGFPASVPLARLAPRPQARAAVDEALRTPSLVRRVLGEVGLAPARTVDLRFRATPARAREVAAEVAEGVDTPGRAATLRVSGGRVVATPARPGRGVDEARLSGLLTRLPARVTVPVGPVDPAVSDAQAEAARALAERVASRPVVVRGAGRRATIPRATLLEALRFRQGAAGIDVSLDPAMLAGAVRPAFDGILRPVRSAGFAVDGAQVGVVPSQDGRRLDAEALARRVRRADGRPVAVPVVAEIPARTTRQAEALGIREQVSTFTTPHACCQPRVTNIQRAAQILDGTIIPAGATFSLNEAIGERTRARGFVPAPQINAGELEDAVGGGVSQMGTTVFNASFFAGLRLVVHTPHEFWITRYPPGREATISWGGPEMIVENDWPAAILMKVRDDGTSLTVSMYSTRLGRRVATTSSGNAVEGAAFTETVTRKVWRGSALRRDETYAWTYKAPPAGE